MPARVRQVVAHEAATGMRQLVGSRMMAALEVSETVLGDALRSVRELPRTDGRRASSGEPPAVAEGAVSIARLIKLVASTEIRAAEGAMTLNLEIRV